MITTKKLTTLLTTFMLVSSLNSFGQNLLLFKDSRSIPTTPASYSYTFEPHFKEGRSIGLSEVLPNAYYTVLGMRAWHDDTGVKAHELAFSNDGRILFRSGYSAGWDNWRSLLISNENGFVGIGTSSPKFLLDVNGNLRAREVKVEGGIWPDYVFNKSYQLPSLLETEQFILKNGHLPGIPSAKEVKKDGVNLGEMNGKLLEKIEELTLHLIEMEKKNAEVQSIYLKQAELIKQQQQDILDLKTKIK